MWYEMFWDRKDKFGGEAIRDKKVYAIDYRNLKIVKGKVGNFCATIGVFHIWCGENKDDWYDVTATWNDIEPLTDEGYNILADRLKTIKEREECQ